MKNVKRDSKYIIKRILIGVGIALILANLRKCNVYADSPTAFNYMGNSVPLNQENRSYFSFSNGLTFVNHNPNDFLNNNPTGYFYKTGVVGFKNKNNGDLIAHELIYYNTNLNDVNYLSLFSGVIFDDDTINNRFVFLNNLDPTFNSIDANSYGVFISTDLDRRNSFKNSHSHYGQYSFTLNLKGVNYYICSFTQQSPTFDFNYNNWDYLGGNSFLPNLDLSNFYYIDNNILVHTSSIVPDIPAGYSEIDISDYQAVYFVPKNYNTIPTRLIDNTKFIDFNFYYKGNINRGYFNIKNNSQVVFSPPTNINGSESDFSYIEASFPYYYDERVSHDVSAYIIYNTGTNTLIRYDSSLFDYYLVKDLSDYANEIIYINENGEQVSDYISFTETLQEKWNKGFNTGGEDWVDNACSNGQYCSKNIDSYLNLLSLPFNFLKKLGSGTCKPINLTLPFINTQVSLPCLSSTLKSFLGIGFYNIFIVLLTSLVVYRVVWNNVVFYTEVLKPENSKLEMIDL